MESRSVYSILALLLKDGVEMSSKERRVGKRKKLEEGDLRKQKGGRSLGGGSARYLKKIRPWAQPFWKAKKKFGRVGPTQAKMEG